VSPDSGTVYVVVEHFSGNGDDFTITAFRA
jgi:hypothetical protein